MADFKLSDTVIIIICAGGVVLIIAVVLLLILCITSKTKDDVRPIRPPPSRRPAQLVNEGRPRRQVMPKPPPYSELPPDYTDWTYREISDIAETANESPSSSSRGLRRTNSIRTRNGSPHPSTSTSARNRPSPERNDVRLHTNARDTGASHFQNEASVSHHRRDHHREHHRFSEPTMENQVRNPPVILDAVAASHDFEQTRLATNRTSDLLPGEINFGESPPPTNPAAALRHEQRRQALNTLQIRRLQMMSPSPPPAYELR